MKINAYRAGGIEIKSAHTNEVNELRHKLMLINTIDFKRIRTVEMLTKLTSVETIDKAVLKQSVIE